MTRDSPQTALEVHHDTPSNHPVMRARFENNGSPRYVLYTIKKYDLDHNHGFYLDVKLVSDAIKNDKETVEVKLQRGEADLIDIDYISTARERADGAPIVAIHPYGQTVGGLVVPTHSDIRELTDLTGSRIGIVRRLDKNWILVKAACREYHDFDPEERATAVVTGSKTELTDCLRRGDADGVLQFWQLIPQLVESSDYREVLPMSRLIQRLSGTDEKIPISTFLTRESYLDEHPKVVQGFCEAYQDAVSILKEDDDLWRELGEEMMGGVDEVVVSAIRDGWREMVVADWNYETIEGMRQLFNHLRKVVGSNTLGVEQIPEGTFALEEEEW